MVGESPQHEETVSKGRLTTTALNYYSKITMKKTDTEKWHAFKIKLHFTLIHRGRALKERRWLS